MKSIQKQHFNSYQSALRGWLPGAKADLHLLATVEPHLRIVASTRHSSFTLSLSKNASQVHEEGPIRCEQAYDMRISRGFRAIAHLPP